jgi:hypothetical protein
MAQLEVSEFIRPKYLTERAYSIANALWPKVYTYIEMRGGIRQYLNSIKLDNNTFSDPALSKVFYNYFSQLLNPAGFFIKEFNVVFERTNDNSYGAANSFLMIASKGSAKIPLIVFDVCVSNVLDVTESQVLEILFHELTHIEQAANLLLELSAEKLTEALPINKPVFIERLEQYFIDRNVDPHINDGEISSYARELALKVFTKYKVELKHLIPEERKTFLFKQVIPYYEEHMSPAVKENVFDGLSNSSKGKFLRDFVTQLYDFCDGLL